MCAPRAAHKFTWHAWVVKIYGRDLIDNVSGVFPNVANNPIPMKATLIVCPNAIVSQWEEEIHKHVVSGKLNVCIYKGIQVQEEHYHPFHFEHYDVVLTTYQVLRNELSHTDIQRRTSKFKKALRRKTFAANKYTMVARLHG